MFKLRNQRMHYAWGDRNSIPAIIGEPTSAVPTAEYWLGAHPSASSVLVCHESQPSLAAWIRATPDVALGQIVTETYGNRLPFLLKLLAVAEPLSLQVHPISSVARAGFRQENRRGVDQKAASRNYKDPFHKPEMIYALSPFEGMAGFRAIPEIIEIMRAAGDLWLRSLAGELQEVLHPAGNAQVIKSVVRHILSLPPHVVAAHIARIRTNVARRRESGAWDGLEHHSEIEFSFKVFDDLAVRYPKDPGALVALLLNPFSLQPGEAYYVPAGAIHCYLSGTGVEIMATSDNVLRAGLTAKHVDVNELLKATEFGSTDVPRPVTPGVIAEGLHQFLPGADEFELLTCTWEQPTTLDLSAECCKDDAGTRIDGGPRILLCLRGSFDVTANLDHASSRTMAQGESLFVPAAAGGITIAGAGHLVVARVPGA